MDILECGDESRRKSFVDEFDHTEVETLMNQLNVIRATQHPHCLVCGGEGEPLYEAMQDRLYGASGTWTLTKCKSAGCSLVWLDPMPDRRDIAKAYSNYYTHESVVLKKGRLSRLNDMAVEGYLDLMYGYPASGRRWVKQTLGGLFFLLPGRRIDADFSVMWLKNTSGGRLLDVGCGSGDMLMRTQKLGWNVQGLDFDPQAVEAACKKGLNVKLGSFSEQDFTSDSFDVVTMSHVFEHVHDPVALLEFCKRVLKPGGRLILVTPNNESLLHNIYRKNWKPLEPPRHLYLFNSATLATLAKRAGFSDVAVKTIIRDANGIFLGSQSLKYTGKYDMSKLQPLRLRLLATWIQVFEWIVRFFMRNSGEEILLITRK